MILSIDRFLMIRFRTWKSKYLSPNRALAIAIMTVLTLIIINLNVIITFGYEEKINNTNIIYCYNDERFPSTKWMDTYNKVLKLLINFAFLINLRIKFSSLIFLLKLNPFLFH